MLFLSSVPLLRKIYEIQLFFSSDSNLGLDSDHLFRSDMQSCRSFIRQHNQNSVGFFSCVLCHHIITSMMTNIKSLLSIIRTSFVINASANVLQMDFTSWVIQTKVKVVTKALTVGYPGISTWRPWLSLANQMWYCPMKSWNKSNKSSNKFLRGIRSQQKFFKILKKIIEFPEQIKDNFRQRIAPQNSPWYE